MEPKDIEIVSGDGNEIEISPVEEHINSLRPKQKDNKKKVIIPDEKK